MSLGTWVDLIFSGRGRPDLLRGRQCEVAGNSLLTLVRQYWC